MVASRKEIPSVWGRNVPYIPFCTILMFYSVHELLFPIKKKDFIYLFIFRERGRGGEREGEKRQCVVDSCAPPTRDLAFNPGMCHGWALNRQAFDSQAGTQSTELHKPGPE